jgi:tetratricopeptide (TPR) repeat protein
LSDTPDAGVTAAGQLSVIRFLEGRFIELEPLLLDIVRQLPGVPIYLASLAAMYADAGRLADAQAAIDSLNAKGPGDIPRDGLWKALRYQQSHACAEISDRGTAAQLYPELIPYASSNATIAHFNAYGSMARVIGRLATVLERYDEAEQHFETALAANDRMGFHAWTAWTRLNYGDMLLRRNGAGDRERAIALLQQAHDFAKESGMGKVQRDSERLLATLA